MNSFAEILRRMMHLGIPSKLGNKKSAIIAKALSVRLDAGEAVMIRRKGNREFEFWAIPNKK